MRSVKVSSTLDKFAQIINIDDFELIADEPGDLGGSNKGPAPFDFVLAGLGACKAMTVKMYADRKGWQVSHIAVELSQVQEGKSQSINAKLTIEGDLTAEQRQRLLEIADKCPVHKSLSAGMEIHSHY